MKDKYVDLINQTFDFPVDEFTLNEDFELTYQNIPLMDIVEQYGTPLKFTYLPKISENIKKARTWFNVAMAKVDYKAKYHYCYCTKSSHFSHVLEEVLRNDVHLETSSAFDIHLILSLFEQGLIKKDKYIVCNGFKLQAYIDNIALIMNEGFSNVIPVIDNVREIDLLSNAVQGNFKVGMRIAAEEEPKFPFYTSRLGIGYKDIVPLYKEKIQKNKRMQLKMLHFFINTGIEDDAYYWNELHKCLNVYCELKKMCPELDSLNIGGGFPIKNSLKFDFDYE